MNAAINRACCEFEEEIRAGRSPEIEPYLGAEGIAEEDRDELLEELIRVECELRREAGESPRLSAYLARFPARQGAVRRAFAPPESAKTGDTTLPYVAPGSSPSQLPAVEGYRIVRVIGRGGMGIVYEAEALDLGRPCALKMILAGAFADASASSRFLSEARITAELDHPGIVRVHRIGDRAGVAFLEMEYLGGETLADRLDGTPWKPAPATRLLRALADAVAYAHRSGVVHRDLKPGNILFAASGSPKIADFGLAKTLGEDRGLTLTYEIFGSPSYMAPEQARGESRSVGPAADIYALGVILYELLTGRPPFKAPTIEETLEQVKRNDPVPPSRLQPGIPRDLETICLHCLQKEPGRRFATAEALAEDLDRFRDGRPIRSRRTTATGRAWRWCRRNPLPATLLGLLGLLLASGSIASAIAAEVFRRNYATVKAQESVILQQNEEYRERSIEAWLNEAAALRMSDRIGQRFKALKLVDRAAVESLSPAVRDSAIACLVLPDLHPIRQWDPRAADAFLFAFDHHSRHYARLDRDGNISVSLVGEPKPLFRMPSVPRPGEGQALLFSPDGNHLAVPDNPEGIYAIWDLVRREPVADRIGPVSGGAIAFTPDGAQLAYVRPDRRLAWAALSGKSSPKAPWELEGIPKSIAFRPDGGRLALLQGTSVEIREVADGDLVRRGEIEGSGSSLAWAPDGSLLAVGGMDGDIRLLNPETLEARGELPGSARQAVHIEFSPDRNLLVAAGDLGLAELWDWRTRRRLLTFPTWNPPALAFREDGQRLIYLDSKGKANLCEIATGRECRTDPLGDEGSPGQVRAIAPHPSLPLLALATEAGVRLLDGKSGRPLGLLPGGDARWVAFDAAGTLICADAEGIVRWPIAPAEGNEALRIGPPIRSPMTAGGSSWSCSRNGTVLAIGRGDRVEIRLNQGGKPAAERPPSIDLEHEAASLDVSPDGRWLVTVGRDQRGPRVWEARTGGKVRELGEGSYSDARFSPDGRWLAGIGPESTKVWRAGDWEPATEISGRLLGFSPDGGAVALARDLGTIRIEDLAGEKAGEGIGLADPDGRDGLMAAFSPDGSCLWVVGGPAREVIAWDFETIRRELGPLGLDWDRPRLGGPPSAGTPPAAISKIEIVGAEAGAR